MRHDFALTLELAFRRITGEDRMAFGGLLSAGVFENGNIEAIGTLILQTANTLRRVIENMDFKPEEEENGRPYTLLITSIEKLQRIGQTMEQMPDRELDECDWDIISSLLFIIAGFIDHYDLRD
jgi:hypothetical protein